MYFCGANDGKGDVPPDKPGLMALACKDGALALWCRGPVVRRRDLGNVFERDGMGDVWEPSISAESSSSSFSGMFGSMVRPLHDGVPGYISSIADRKGLLLLPECSGEEGLLGAP